MSDMDPQFSQPLSTDPCLPLTSVSSWDPRVSCSFACKPLSGRWQTGEQIRAQREHYRKLARLGLGDAR